ncbi:MAG: hypothetical protein HZC28_12370 [Spirochaetes bacterium]|nr:hypothetical protein [Spirochaetota bacterium]
MKIPLSRQTITAIALAGSLTVIAILQYALMTSRGNDIVRVLLVLAFLFDFYFCAEYFSSAFRQASLKSFLRYLRSYTGIIDLVHSVPLFVLSVMNLLTAFGLVTPDNLIHHEPHAVVTFTLLLPLGTVLYLLRALKLSAAAADLFSNDLTRVLLARCMAAASAAGFAMFLTVFALAAPKVMTGTAFRELAPLITYDLASQADIGSNEYQLIEFAKKYAAVAVYKNKQPIYENPAMDIFRTTHLACETRLVTVQAFDVLIPGKRYNASLQILVLLFFGWSLLLHASIACAGAYGIKRFVTPVIEAVRAPETELSPFVCLKHTTGIKEMDAVARQHNQYIVQKIRERYIRDFIVPGGI